MLSSAYGAHLSPSRASTSAPFHILATRYDEYPLVHPRDMLSVIENGTASQPRSPRENVLPRRGEDHARGRSRSRGNQKRSRTPHVACIHAPLG